LLYIFIASKRAWILDAEERRQVMKSVRTNRERDIKERHPCFSLAAHERFGRIHLPVAPACNIQCNYCLRKYDCANESRPGVSSVVLSSKDAVERVRALVERNERLSVVGIAGPGDPLVNEATFETMRALNREFPELILCLSTNGLCLADRIEDLMKTGVKSITITMNAVMPETAAKIYSMVSYHGKRYTGMEGAECLLCNQWRGLRNAIDAGFIIKVNSVLIPGVNESELPIIAWMAGGKGADIMNILPLIPQAVFEGYPRPSRDMLHSLRSECGQYIPQMTHCRQCRADACGTLGEDGDMELAVLQARIGEDYCEMIN
jgi:nitrogen fixation protein NifB